MQKLNLKKKKLVSYVILFAVILCSLSGIVNATIDDVINHERKASLTIIKYENRHGTNMDSTENKPLKGVTFTIYKLDDDNLKKSAEEIYKDIKDKNIILEEKSLETGKEGTVKFEDLELGRYLVAETKAPKNVSSVISPFLIDLPRTSDNGEYWNYDVTVEPKNETVYGDVTLSKLNKNNNPLEGVIWELQVKNGKDWSKYDYNETLMTNAEGKIIIKNLPVGNYRLIEIQTLEGYILDKSNIKEFIVSKDNTSFTFDNIINEKLSIKKEIKTDNGYCKSVGIYKEDEIEWRITADIATIIEKLDTYYITDVMSNGLDYISDSIKIIAQKTGTLLEKNLILEKDYTVTLNNQNMKINFVTSSLKGHDVIYVTYNTIFNSNVIYGKRNENKVALTYTDKINIDGTSDKSIYKTESDIAEVHTGKLLVKKVDKEGVFLSGAKFYIATTEENAKKGIYVKNKNEENLTAISNENGDVVFTGLKYGEDGISAEEGESFYYLIEYESPTYNEDGEIKHYNLLSKPVKVIVNSNSGNYEKGVTVEIVNKKGFKLPFTGGTMTLLLIFLGTILIGVSIKIKRKKGAC